MLILCNSIASSWYDCWDHNQAQRIYASDLNLHRYTLPWKFSKTSVFHANTHVSVILKAIGKKFIPDTPSY